MNLNVKEENRQHETSTTDDILDYTVRRGSGMNDTGQSQSPLRRSESR